MHYNFDEVIDRSENYAAKFQEADLHYGTNSVIPLWIADMDFKTAQPIIDAIHKRADQGIFGYTYRPEEYFKAISNWQEKRNGYTPDIAKMAFTPGVVPGMRLLINLFTKEDDKIIIQQPVYHPFADVVENTGRQLLVNPLKSENGCYTMDYEDFEEKAKKGARYFILCNPHNPVGRVWTKEELKRVGDICVKYGIEIISDEIHSDLILDGHKHTVMASVSKEIEKLTITCIAPSKTFNLAGLQSATMIFNNEETKNIYISELKKMDIARNNCFSLVATMAACEQGEEWLNQLLTYISDNMKFIREYCEKNIPVLKPNSPEATYLCWIDASGLKMTDEELLKFTVEKAGVAFGMGHDFGYGGSGFLRLNAATPRSVIKKALEQLKVAVDNL
ncbi:MAG: MalY/PatB family protein [Lachnospiraceae bacterium]|nr:MalY/PatB family protein [Lachnospiraceae bacterium]